MVVKLKQDLSLGSNMKRLRKRAGLTQEQVAVKMQLQGINISRDFYAHIENGSYNIRVSELIALHTIFECSYDDFFEGLAIIN